MKRASFFVRGLAFWIDMMIVIFLGGAVLLAATAGYLMGVERYSLPGMARLTLTFVVAGSFVYFFYFTYLNMHGGATVGKRIMGIRVIHRGGMGVGMELGFMRAFLRSLFYVLSAWFFGLGFLMALFLDGRTLHDILTDTQVVEEDS
jgi:uncharacterized RDD family membrane protein YckC